MSWASYSISLALIGTDFSSVREHSVPNSFPKGCSEESVGSSIDSLGEHPLDTCCSGSSVSGLPMDQVGTPYFPACLETDYQEF